MSFLFNQTFLGWWLLIIFAHLFWARGNWSPTSSGYRRWMVEPMIVVDDWMVNWLLVVNVDGLWWSIDGWWWWSWWSRQWWLDGLRVHSVHHLTHGQGTMGIHGPWWFFVRHLFNCKFRLNFTAGSDGLMTNYQGQWSMMFDHPMINCSMRVNRFDDDVVWRGDYLARIIQ